MAKWEQLKKYIYLLEYIRRATSCIGWKEEETKKRTAANWRIDRVQQTILALFKVLAFCAKTDTRKVTNSLLK